MTISADYFLQLAADAAWAIMEQNKYSLYKGNTLKLDAPYREYFILEDGDAKETILSMRFNADILVRHGIQFTFRNMRHSATQRLVNHYLMADGSKIQDQPGYETMTYNQQFQNRDPRMAQTLMAPGYVDLNGIDEVIEDCKSYDMTGYRFIKFVSDDTHNGATTSTTDLAGIPLSGNPAHLRRGQGRAGHADPGRHRPDRGHRPRPRGHAGPRHGGRQQQSRSPDGQLLPQRQFRSEQRRDPRNPPRTHRRTSLRRPAPVGYAPLEGGRPTGSLVERTRRLPRLLLPLAGRIRHDGDGKMDLCLWSGTKPATTCDAMLEIGEGKDAQLTDGTSGYIVCFRGRTYKWEEGRDYLWPIPTDQRVATGGALSQNPGYEDGLSF